MALVGTDHTHHTLAADDLAIAADFLDRSRDSHFILLKLVVQSRHCGKDHNQPAAVHGRLMVNRAFSHKIGARVGSARKR